MGHGCHICDCPNGCECNAKPVVGTVTHSPDFKSERKPSAVYRCRTDLEVLIEVEAERDQLRAQLAAAEAWRTEHLEEYERWKGKCQERVDELETRKSELLALVAKLSQETPLDDEVKGALASRGALLAEVGTLKAALSAAERRAGEAADIEARMWGFRDDLKAMQAERDALAAEVERLRSMATDKQRIKAIDRWLVENQKRLTPDKHPTETEQLRARIAELEQQMDELIDSMTAAELKNTPSHKPTRGRPRKPR